MDYSESMLRQRIAAIPDGEYRAEGWLDDDGRNRGQHLPVKVCVRVIGDRIEVDLTGSAPPCKTCPITNPSIAKLILLHQMAGLNN